MNQCPTRLNTDTEKEKPETTHDSFIYEKRGSMCSHFGNQYVELLSCCFSQFMNSQGTLKSKRIIKTHTIHSKGHESTVRIIEKHKEKKNTSQPQKTEYEWVKDKSKGKKERTTHAEGQLRSSRQLSYSFPWSYFPWPDFPLPGLIFLIGEIWFLKWWTRLLWLHTITMFEEEHETDS